MKRRLPLLTQKAYNRKLRYAYARGYQAYAYVENIRKYEISLVGYLLEKEKELARMLKLAQCYPAVSSEKLDQPTYGVLPFSALTVDEAFAHNSILPQDTL